MILNLGDALKTNGVSFMLNFFPDHTVYSFDSVTVLVHIQNANDQIIFDGIFILCMITATIL